MLLGCDISHYQGAPNYPQLKLDGLSFVIEKAVQGTYVDPMFAANRHGVLDAGLVNGSYAFANGGDPAAEANFYADTVGTLVGGELAVLDYEIQLPNPVQWCLTWLQTTEARLGIKAFVYLNQSTANGYDWSPVVAANYPLWLAKYDDVTTAPSVAHWPFAAIKQYTDRGTEAGIGGLVDLDVYYGDATSLDRYGFHSNVIAPPAPSPAPAPLPPAPPAFDVRAWRAHIGATGAIFEHLQLWLNRCYPAYSHIGPVAPVYGPQTAGVLAEFCRRSGIASDGRDIGPRTSAALYAAGFRG